jgi:phosphoserine phosphatase
VSHFGFDLDNTLIDYSESCREYTKQHGLSEVSSVDQLRRLLNSDIKHCLDFCTILDIWRRIAVRFHKLLCNQFTGKFASGWLATINS